EHRGQSDKSDGDVGSELRGSIPLFRLQRWRCHLVDHRRFPTQRYIDRVESRRIRGAGYNYEGNPPDPGTGPNAAPIETFAGFGPPINIWFGPTQSINNDQPWIRTGPNDHVYVTFNNLDEIIGGPIGG